MGVKALTLCGPRRPVRAEPLGRARSKQQVAPPFWQVWLSHPSETPVSLKRPPNIPVFSQSTQYFFFIFCKLTCTKTASECIDVHVTSAWLKVSWIMCFTQSCHCLHVHGPASQHRLSLLGAVLYIFTNCSSLRRPWDGNSIPKTRTSATVFMMMKQKEEGDVQALHTTASRLSFWFSFHIVSRVGSSPRG